MRESKQAPSKTTNIPESHKCSGLRGEIPLGLGQTGSILGFGGHMRLCHIFFVIDNPLKQLLALHKL